jgi:hypothetical protein
MRKLLMTAVCLGVFVLSFAAPALASVTPTTGQPGAPNNVCGVNPITGVVNSVTPGASASSPGSPFNPSGQAGKVYAGNPGTASLAHSNSSATVSQYDAACVRLSSH